MSEYDNAYYERNNNWKPSKVPYRENKKNKRINSRADKQLTRYKYLKNRLLNTIRGK